MLRSVRIALFAVHCLVQSERRAGEEVIWPTSRERARRIAVSRSPGSLRNALFSPTAVIADLSSPTVWKFRFFVPIGAAGSEVLARLLERHPLTGVADLNAA